MSSVVESNQHVESGEEGCVEAPKPDQNLVKSGPEPECKTPEEEPPKEKGLDEVEEYDDFEQMGISDDLLRGIYGYGMEKPSVIQKKAIVCISTGRDVIAQSQSGTGKTGSFAIGVCMRLDPTLKRTQAIFVAPTRELADQIADVTNSVITHTDLRTYLCVGGTSVRDGILTLRQGVQIVVGTPGRIVHMLRDGALSTEDLRAIVLDEADELLGNGFIDQLYDMFQMLPPSVQVCLMSATMPRPILELTERIMSKPIRILIPQETVSLEGIAQYYVLLDGPGWKLDTLCDLYGSIDITQAMIFCNLRRTAEWLTDQLSQRDHAVSLIHGDLDPQERTKIMRDFKFGRTRVLVSTDLLGRGINVQQVSLVINYDMPRQPEAYIHRVGRCGRYGKKGSALSFIVPEDASVVRQVESIYGTKLRELEQSNLSEF